MSFQKFFLHTFCHTAYYANIQALNCGVDAVFDIPAPFSTSSAEDFAMYGVALLEALGADFISFGCEDAGENILNDLHLISYILLGKNKCRQMFSAALKAEPGAGGFLVFRVGFNA